VGLLTPSLPCSKLFKDFDREDVEEDIWA
jgi:hypothetical protein